MELEEKKQEAVRNENYEDAKIINEKMKRLRDNNDTHNSGPKIESYQ